MIPPVKKGRHLPTSCPFFSYLQIFYLSVTILPLPSYGLILWAWPAQPYRQTRLLGETTFYHPRITCSIRRRHPFSLAVPYAWNGLSLHVRTAASLLFQITPNTTPFPGVLWPFGTGLNVNMYYWFNGIFFLFPLACTSHRFFLLCFPLLNPEQGLALCSVISGATWHTSDTKWIIIITKIYFIKEHC